MRLQSGTYLRPSYQVWQDSRLVSVRLRRKATFATNHACSRDVYK
jgi:hypothetical protein